MTSRERNPAPFGFRFVTPLALGSVLNPLNSTMIATALVPIANGLHASAAQTAWLIVCLYMTSAVAQPTMGRFADLFGPRRIFLISLVFVAAAGVLGWLAASLSALIAVRVLLGIGTSAAYPAAMRIFRLQADRIGSNPPRVAMGVLSLAALSTTAIGPVVGGLLTGAFGWHSIFVANVPLALLTAVLLLLWIARDEPTGGGFQRFFREMDLTGIGLFTGFLLSLMVFLMELRSEPHWLALAGAVVLGALLTGHSLRHSEPFIDVRMLVRNKPLTVTYLRAATASMIVFCVYYGCAQWLQSAVGLSSARAGLVTVPMSVVAALSSLVGVRSKGLRAPFLISISCALVGCICLYFLNSDTSMGWVTVALAFFGVPMGTFSTATQAAIYIQSPGDAIGTAAGLQRTAQYMGASVAAALLAFIYGQRATDMSLHHLSIVMAVVSASLLLVTLFDRTIPLLSPAAGHPIATSS
jgi:MFS family permease